MHKHAASILLPFVLAACGSAPKAPPAPAPDPHADAVAGLVGGLWAGQATDTPMGPFPFAIAFDREPSGDIHGRAERDGMFLDFRFHRDAGGLWTLIEDGQIPGVGRQTHEMIPAPAGPDGPRWVTKDDPSFVDIALAIENDALVLTAKVHGEPHAVFELARRAVSSAATAAR